MERTDPRSPADGRLALAACDYCGHQHACYVGGRPIGDDAPRREGWERHVCLGCLMRAAVPGGFDSCPDCRLAVPAESDAAYGSPR